MNTFKARLVSILILVCLLAARPVSYARAAPKVYRVKPTGLTSGTCGSTWSNACGLKRALNLAVAGNQLWVAAGTYKPTTGTDRTVSFVLENGVAIYGGFAGTETALAQRNPVVNATVLSGDIGAVGDFNDNSFHVVVGSGTDNTAILDGFTITNGNSDWANGEAGRGDGGGMLILAGNPTLVNLIFNNNRTGVYGAGGGLMNTGNPILTNIIFSGNHAGGGGGGGLANSGSATLQNVTFSNNTAANGGGMSSTTPSSPLPNVTLTNVTFSGNTAQNYGGGLYNSGSPTLTNVTFFDNEATLYHGGGMASWGGTPALRNTILWGNTAPAGSGPQIYTGGDSPSVSDSLVEGGCPAGSTCSGIIIISNPQLSALGDYGGFTPTHRLLPGSPAIDHGNDAVCPAIDQRGALRPQDGDGNGSAICDIGTYEYGHEIFFVKQGATGDNNGVSWDHAYTNLSSALDGAVSGDQVWVAAGTYTPGILREESFLLQSGVAVYGGFAGTETALEQRNALVNGTILSGDIGTGGDNSDNSYHVVVVAGDAASTTVLDGFTITGGNANGASGSNYNTGGGLFNTGGSPTLANLTFGNNLASAYGGGMYNDYGSPTLTGVMFSSNSVNGPDGSGGGLFNAAGSPILTWVAFNSNTVLTGTGGGMSSGPNASAAPMLTDVTFSNNSATNGGGIYNNGINTAFTNVTFIGNFTSENGGGLYNAGQSPTLTDVVFRDNYVGSDRFGGGIYNASGSPTLMNVTFDHNFGGVSCENRSGYGGGMYNDDGSPTLTNVTFSGNCAYEGGGIVLGGSPVLTNVTVSNNTAQYRGGGLSNAGNLTLINAILWGNSASLGPQLYHYSGYSSSISYSVVQGGCPTGATCSNIITADPLLGTFGNYGGFTATLPIGDGSSAFDAGDDEDCPNLDQRGTTRPQGLHCDIGAFELIVPYPILATPANGDPLLHRRPTFDWSNVSGASSYQIVASTSSSFSSLLWKVDTTTSTYTRPTDLPAGKVIYWRVRAKVSGVWSPWSETWGFTTPKSPSIPVLVSPANKAITRNYIPLLNWNNSTIPSGGAAFDHYQVQVSTDNTFPEPLLIDDVTPTGNRSASFYTPGTALAPNQQYYWRVRAYNVAGEYSSWSTVRTFFTALLPPGNLTPTGGEIVPTRKPVLDWNAVDSASGYTVQVSTSSTFGTLLVNAKVTADTFTPSTNLPANKTLYWRVRATGTNGPSSWTSDSFHTP